MSDIREWWADESDRLRPFGLDPADDMLEQRAREEAAADRAFDHTPAPRWSPL